jgi:acyl carrier protein
MSRPISELYESFSSALNIPLGAVSDQLAYSTIPEWDSIAHMALIAELERRFDVMFDTDDILAMSSVAIASQLLEKHGVNFSN